MKPIGYRMYWVGPEAGGYARPSQPRRVDGGTAEDYKWLRSRDAPRDLTGRPTLPVPAAFEPSPNYRPRGAPAINWRQFSLLGRYMPSGLVQPYQVPVERRYVRTLIQRHRQQAQPIKRWCAVYWHVFDRKSARQLPQRPALRFPTYNFAQVTEEEMVERARIRAKLARRGK